MRGFFLDYQRGWGGAPSHGNRKQKIGCWYNDRHFKKKLGTETATNVHYGSLLYLDATPCPRLAAPAVRDERDAISAT